MAGGRRHDEGERLGLLMSWVALVAVGERIDPQQLNPYRREAAAAGRVADHVRTMRWKAMAYLARKRQEGADADRRQ